MRASESPSFQQGAMFCFVSHNLFSIVQIDVLVPCHSTGMLVLFRADCEWPEGRNKDILGLSAVGFCPRCFAGCTGTNRGHVAHQSWRHCISARQRHVQGRRIGALGCRNATPEPQSEECVQPRSRDLRTLTGSCCSECSVHLA